MTLKRHPLGLAVTLVLATAVAGSPAFAQSIAAPAGVATPDGTAATVATAAPAPAAARDDEPATLATVNAVAISEDADRISAPYSVVSGDDLLRKGAGTLGEALDSLPGVRADTFGGGSSRPVIRGQVGPRVKVLSDSTSVLDASDISPDHAVTVDPLLGSQVEVLRGPATLLYGGGAIGGVVNVIDDKIARELPQDGREGRLVIRGNTVAEERAAAASLTQQIGGNFVLHAEGSWRDADDYRVPDQEERRVDGTFAESRNASVGLSWIGDTGHVGLAYSYRDDDYGLPGHSHEYESCHPHGSALHCGDHGGDDDHDHDHDHEHEAPPTIDLLSKRVDLRGEFADPFAGFSRIRFRAAHTDYRHHELEEGEIATTFSNRGYETRIELEHKPIGAWTGVFGLQHSDTTFNAVGEESFMPKVDTRATGLFLVEHFEPSEQWHFELGARHEWLEHTPIDDARNRPRFDDTATSYAASAIWEFMPDVSLTFSAAHSERLPHAQELYARGVHLATNTYECGLLPSALTCGGAANDRAFDKESSRNYELMLRRMAGDFTFSVGAYVNRIDDYIYARTLDRFEDFRLIKYSQRDVDFRGVEAEVGYRFTEVLSATVFLDHVRAEFADGGGNVPRIPGSRFGGRLNAAWEAIDGELELYHVGRQRDIADFETETPGYDMLNLTVNYRFADGRTRVFVRGSNLLDEQVWNHASFLADSVPLPGRNLSVGLTYDF